MKKFLSVILTAVIVLSLFPSVFAAETEAATEYVYLFGSNTQDIVSSAWVDKVEDGAYTYGEYKSGEDSKGNAFDRMWKYYKISKESTTATDDSIFFSTDGIQLPKDSSGRWVALKFKVPEVGTYSVGYTALDNSPNNAYTGLFIYTDSNITSDDISDKSTKESDDMYAYTKHDYYYDITANKSRVSYTSDKTLEVTTSGQEFVLVYKSFSSKTASLYNMTLTKISQYSEDFAPDTSFAYKSSPKTAYTRASVTPLFYANDGVEIAPVVSAAKGTTAGNGKFNVTADATVTAGDGTVYKFLYWAKGLTGGEDKRIVSLEPNFTYAGDNGVNYLIAVYAKDEKIDATKYMDANGQVLDSAEGEPALPSMAGYGTAKSWYDHGNGIKEAIYGNAFEYNITVSNGSGSGTYAYGKAVTCTANAPAEGKIFLGWKKTVNDEDAGLVSVDETYTFSAWENCTVEAVYGEETLKLRDGLARRILIGALPAGEDTAYMAEFIGFAGESTPMRGITLGTTDYTMTNPEVNQFTITDDGDPAATAVSAFAITTDGTKHIYNLK